MSERPAETTAAPVSKVPLLLFVQGLTAFTVFIGIVVGAHYYLGVRLIRDAGLPSPWSTIGWFALYGAFAAILLGFLAGRVLPKPLAIVLQWVGFGWMGAFGLLLTSTLVSDLVLLGWRQVGEVPPSAGAMRAVLISLGTVLALAWAFRVARGLPTLERVEVKVPNLPSGLDGFTIAQLSDIHIGETLGRAFLERVVGLVNGLKADAVALTGDIVEGSVARVKEQLKPLGELESRHGTFYVTGNHEYYHGATAWMAEVQSLGVTVLHNAHRVLEHQGEKLTIGGVPDLEGRRFDPSHAPDVDRAFAGAPAASEAPRILLAHQPRFAAKAKDAGISLQLSGHTHGGQIFPFMFFVRLQQPVIAGFKRLWGVPVYTSRGTGYWGPPFRLGPKSEVALLTLRSA